MGTLPPRILAILPGFIPSTIICIVKPFLRLHQAGHITAKITLERLVNKKNLKWADLVVFCRNTEPRHAHLMDYLLTQNTPFIYELDDNFFELPLNSEFGRYHRSPERLAMLTNYIKFAKLVRIYSKPLLKKVKTLNPKAEQVVGPIDLSLIGPPLNVDSKKIKLVYGTSRIQDELSAIFTPALIRILEEYAGKVEIHFWGAVPSELKGHSGVIYHRIIRDYDRFLRRFSRGGFDIGLAPLPDDLFHRSKTNNKFREYGACRIAGIYSNVDVYADCVTDGETGVLVPNDPEAWYQAMVRLIEDRDLREKIKNQAQRFVWEKYSQEKFKDLWFHHIQQVLADKDKALMFHRPVNEIKHDVTSSRQKDLGRIKRLLGKGFSANLKILQWRLFDLWMIFKLQYRLHSSSRFNVFKR